MSEFWRIELLGHFQAKKRGAKNSLPSLPARKTDVLLAVLALRRAPVTRAELTALLWSDSEEAAARRSLSMALSHLRPAFGACLITNRHCVALQPECFSTDVAEFQAALEKSRRAAKDDAQIAALQTAVSLYRGGFLPGYAEIKAEAANWITAEYRQLETLYCAALLTLAALLERQGHSADALPYALQAQGLNPYDPEAKAQAQRLAAKCPRQIASTRPAPEEAHPPMSTETARCLMQLAIQASQTLLPENNTAYLAEMERERPELDAALRWTLEEGNDLTTGFELTMVLQEFWYQANRRGEMRFWLETALRFEARFSASQRLELHFALAKALLADYHHAAAFAACQQAMKHAQTDCDTERIVWGLNELGIAAHHAGQDDSSRVAFETALTLLPAKGGSLALRGRLIMDFAVALNTQGETHRALSLCEESLRLAIAAQDAELQALAGYQLAELLQEQGDYSRARRCINESLAIRQERSDPLGVADCLRLLGALHSDQNYFAEARFLLERSAEMYAKFGKDECRAAALGIMGDVEYRQGHLDTAFMYYAEGLEIWRRRPHRRWPAQFLLRQAWAAFRQRKTKQARTLCRDAAKICPAIHAVYTRSGILRLQGHLALQTGNLPVARLLAEESLTLCRPLGNGLKVVEVKETIAAILFEQGQHDEAASLLSEATARRKEMGTPRPPITQSDC